jgi:hypothetical protein
MTAIGLTLGGLCILAFYSQRWRETHDPDLGWMSPQWLAEFRASGC